ncbi:MAG: hypothetical protein EPO42_10165 [Gallionellaceae bacterium]|nr:MAG: hypothetical protein EPO42_10165 [Gallionellaceae bacterium]
MRMIAVLMVVVAMAGCKTYDAMKGNTSKERVASGLKKDAQATGETVERIVHESGQSLGKALKRGGNKLEEASK